MARQHESDVPVEVRSTGLSPVTGYCGGQINQKPSFEIQGNDDQGN